MENVIEEMASLTFHHVGIAVYNFEKVMEFYSLLGYHITSKMYDPEQNVNVCVIEKENQPRIELLAPYDEKSPINGVLNKNGVSPYHICYETHHLTSTMVKLKKLHFMVVVNPKISNVFANRRVAFFFKKDIGLIEIIETIQL